MNIESARTRLECWGDWARENITKGIGYPSQSIEHRMIWGCGDRVIEPENREAEEVDLIVRQLDGELREITKYYYVRKWSTQKIGNKLHVSRKTIEKRLELSVGFVAGRLHTG